MISPPPSAKGASFSILLLLTASCGGEDATLPRLEITSSPTESLIFLDGRFLGETAAEGPLVTHIPAGFHQLRLSHSGHLDEVMDLDLETGKRRLLDVVLEKSSALASARTAPVRIGPAQTLRGVVGPKDKVRINDKDELSAHLYTATGRPGDRCMLTVLAATGLFDLIVTDGEWNHVPTKTIPGPVDCPGLAFREFTVPDDGEVRIAVVPKSVIPPVRYALRFDKALPPIATPKDPKRPGRRLPPPKLAR